MLYILIAIGWIILIIGLVGTFKRGWDFVIELEEADLEKPRMSIDVKP